MHTIIDLTRFDKGRILTLTDGIFAIAMTVLALTLRPPSLPPHPTEAQVWAGIIHILPNLSAYVASFAILGMYWISHHAIFRFVEGIDRTVTWVNLYFLMFVSLVPFTTDFYAGDNNSRIANTVFGANLIVMGLLAYSMWTYSISKNFLHHNLSKEIKNYVTRRILTGPALASLALVATLFQPIYAEYIFFAMIPIFMLSAKIARSGLVFSAESGNNSSDQSS